jgi:hypothetical protein
MVFTIGPSGDVRQVGSYPGPSGADEVRIAPAGFGSAAGDALLTVDAGPDTGALVAMDAGGATKTLAQFPGGPNPIAAIPRTTGAGGTPPRGLYVTNDINPYVYFAPASQLAPFAGDVVVGTENKGQFWIVEPRGSGFAKIRLRTTLRGGNYSLEDCVYVG